MNGYLRDLTAARSARQGRRADAQSVAGTEADAGQTHFTAKDFRTWHGTVQALELTRLACTHSASASEGEDPGEVEKSRAQACTAQSILSKEVTRQLRNTPAVCKKAYVHPAVLELGARLASDAGPGTQRV